MTREARCKWCAKTFDGRFAWHAGDFLFCSSRCGFAWVSFRRRSAAE